jgi:ABC-type transporter Mla subunit MlaD
MSETTLLYVMASFVIISAIALCVQAGMLAAIYKTTKELQQAVAPLLPKVERLVEKTDVTMEQGGRQMTEISTRANAILETSQDILDSTKRQVAIVEDLVGDAAVRARVQMDRAELVLDDTLSRAHETVAVFHDGVMRPLREVNGLAAGIRAALAQLARGNRPTVDQVTSDEEMFI